MIKKIILPLLAVLLLGSCANKFNLVKRKYNKGFYVSRSHSTNTNVTEPERKALVKHTKTNSPATEQKAAEPVKALDHVALVNEPVSEIQKPGGLSKTMETKKESKPVYASAQKNLVKTIKAMKPLAMRSAAKGDSGTNKILLVILALFPFICLIAIYLHDGKKITLNFWITLLLHLTFVLWLVFALLVVLDVLDFA
jgi:hypothetical protein